VRDTLYCDYYYYYFVANFRVPKSPKMRTGSPNMRIIEKGPYYYAWIFTRKITRWFTLKFKNIMNEWNIYHFVFIFPAKIYVAFNSIVPLIFFLFSRISTWVTKRKYDLFGPNLGPFEKTGRYWFYRSAQLLLHADADCVLWLDLVGQAIRGPADTMLVIFSCFSAIYL